MENIHTDVRVWRVNASKKMFQESYWLIEVSQLSLTWKPFSANQLGTLKHVTTHTRYAWVSLLCKIKNKKLLTLESYECKPVRLSLIVRHINVIAESKKTKDCDGSKAFSASFKNSNSYFCLLCSSKSILKIRWLIMWSEMFIALCYILCQFVCDFSFVFLLNFYFNCRCLLSRKKASY